MRRRLSSIRFRALLFFAVTAALMLAAIIAIAISERAQRLTEAKRSLAQAAEVVAAVQNDTLHTTRELVDVAAHTREVREFDVAPAACDRFAEGELKRTPQLVLIFVAAPDGRIPCASSPDTKSINVADREYFRQAVAARGTIIGKALKGRSSGEWGLPFARAIRDDAGNVQGVFVTQLSLGWLSRTMTVGRYPEGTRLGLYGSDGLVLARVPDPEGWVGKAARNPLIDHIAEHPEGGVSETDGLDGVPVVVAYTPFAETAAGRIYLIIGVPRAAVTAEVQEELLWRVGTMLLVIGILLGILWVALERTLLRPMHAIASAARRIGQGDLGARTGLAAKDDEVGHAAQAFDDMAQSLDSMRDVVAAHRALQQSEERYRSVVEDQTEVICRLDGEGTITFANDVFCHLFGRQGEPVVGKRWQLVTFAQDIPQVEAKLRQLSATNPVVVVESRVYDGTGAVRWMQFVNRGFFDAAGQLEVIQSVGRDITDRRHAEDALRASEARARAIIEASPVPFALNDNLQNIAYLNAAFTRTFGYVREDIPTLDVWWPKAYPDEAYRRQVATEWQERLDAAVRDAAPFEPMEVHVRCRDGRMRTALATAARLTYTDERLHLVALFDITERRQAEEQLRELSLAVEQSPESIVITDLDARIQYVNGAFVRNTGYGLAEVVGQNPRVLQSGKTQRAVYDEMWAALGAGHVWKGELVNQRKDGTEYVELATISPLRQQDGTITHYVAVKEDVTEKKRTDEELDRHRHHLERLVEERTRELGQARDDALAADRAKSTFLANMSHEIRTPLNGILGMAYLVRRSGVTPRQAEQLDKIAASGDHLLAIINDVLDLAKIEAGKVVLAEKDFTLAELLDGITAVVGENARAKGLSLERDMIGMPGSLHGDVTRLAQALLNFVSNAVKFTERGGVTVSGRKLEATDAGYLLRFDVVDTGIGIPAETQARLFAPFQQGDGSMTRSYGGTGLGLAITRRLAQLMGGEVGVESTVGIGSRFWMTVRVRRGRAPEAAADPRLEESAEALLRRDHRGVRILLVEDDPINQEVTVALLTDVGAAVDLASDGRTAVECAQRNDYALILMDMQLPEMDGLEATRAIRALPGRHRTPILALTANAFADDEARCREAGMNDYLAKPVVPEKIYEKLLAWLTRPPG